MEPVVAKQPPPKSGTSRIRFIMVDAEISDGDLSQITSAIQNALKPATTVIQQRIAVPSAHPALSGAGAEDDPAEEEIREAEVDTQVSAPRSARRGHHGPGHHPGNRRPKWEARQP